MSIKDISFPFSIDSEEEVRVAISHYFIELGFSLEEMSFEDYFEIQIGHTPLKIRKGLKRGRLGGRSDLLLTENCRPLAIVETKSPDHALTEQDTDQALSYARLIRQMPPYTIVTNGKEFRVYDTFTTDPISSGSPLDSRWYKNGKSYKGFDYRTQFVTRLNETGMGSDSFKK